MIKKFTYLISLVLLISAAFVYAKEPTNLAIYKQTLIQYHDSGAYQADLSKVIADAQSYLEKNLKNHNSTGKKPAIVFDIDETALSNYEHMLTLNFGGSIPQIQALESEGTDPVIESTLQLYRFAQSKGVAVFFVTGRTEKERAATVRNLQQAGYNHWTALYFKPDAYLHKPAEVYKTAVRKQLTTLGYNIILNVGDQASDLMGGYADKAVKLPNPFYFIP